MTAQTAMILIIIKETVMNIMAWIFSALSGATSVSAVINRSVPYPFSLNFWKATPNASMNAVLF